MLKVTITNKPKPLLWYNIGEEYHIADDTPTWDEILQEFVYWPIGCDGCIGVSDCKVEEGGTQ